MSLLGDFTYECGTFDFELSQIELEGNALEKRHGVSAKLLALIEDAPAESFLLAEVVDFIRQVNEAKLLETPYIFSDFEHWLDQHSGLDEAANLRVRGKIVGKWVPREEYQAYFPIGLGRRFAGPHFVTAHNPPDLDTTVASFWGWTDAFAARVSEGLHIWNLPSGEAPAAAARLFTSLFGEKLFTTVPRHNTTLGVSALDMVSQKHVYRAKGEMLTSQLDHGRHDRLIVLVGDEGQYEGCWRSSDVERFRLVTLLVTNLLGWFENTMHMGLVGLFAQADLSRADVKGFLSSVFLQPLGESRPVQELSDDHKELLEKTLQEVLGVATGLSATFADLVEVKGLADVVQQDLFTAEGVLIEDRPKIFRALEHVIATLDTVVHSFSLYLDRLDVAVAIKHKVLGDSFHYVTQRAEIEEIRKTMGSFHYVVVANPSVGGNLLPMGVISAKTLQNATLGTVTLRDFCNREEVKIPSYLEVISVVDHHRASLQTTSFPTAIMGDVQSCNVLLAEQAFLLNDKYSLGGLTAEALENQEVEESRSGERLFRRRLVAKRRGEFFVSSKREFAEYLCFLYAILDDTDLLDRVTARDVVCVAELLNRMKSLMCGREVEIINLDDIPRDGGFANAAARRILQNDEMYSLYGKIYSVRESEVELDCKSYLQGLDSNVFADTKEQKGCARVGQTKLFPKNFPHFLQNISDFRKSWLERASEVHAHRPDLELHMQMITTIPGADEVYTDSAGNYPHRDEMWFWVPPTDEAHDRLASYLSAFGGAPEVEEGTFDVELVGPNCAQLERIFTHHFRNAQVRHNEDHPSDEPMAILRFDAAKITSRKLSVTPYIPSTK